MPGPRAVLLSHGALRDEFLASARAAFGPRTEWHAADGTADAEVASRIAGLPEAPDCAIVLAPLAERVGLAPAVRGIPVGVVALESTEQLRRWFGALSDYRRSEPRVVIAAMQKPSYVRWAGELAQAFGGGPGAEAALRLPATTTRDELADLLSRGFKLCVYAGHGRSRGWSGYRGLRWHHLAAPPTGAVGGAVVSLSCSTLRRDRVHSRPFGLEWIWSGRLCAFMGAVDQVRVSALVSITSLILDARRAGVGTIADLVRRVDAEVGRSGDPDLAAGWATFRVIGNPLQPI